MVPFSEFAAAAPELAAPTRARFEAAGIAILGTVRADGSPRLSPIEVSFHGDRLYVGMMPASKKAVDLARDPRCALLTALADKHDLAGEGKLAATVRRLVGSEWATVLGAMAEGLETDPTEFGDSPVFELLVREASWQFVAEDTFHTWSWRPGLPVRRRARHGPVGTVVED
jgi:hypothetical protein